MATTRYTCSPDREEGVPNDGHLHLEVADDGRDVGRLVTDGGETAPGHARHGGELGYNGGLQIGN